MRRKIRIINFNIIILAFLLMLSCCKSVHEKNNKIDKNEFELTKVNEYTVCTPKTYIQSYQYFEVGNKNYLSLLDQIEPYIWLFDYKTKELIRKIPVPKSDIGRSSILMHVMYNMDSILLVNFFTDPTIFWLDSLGNITKQQKIPFKESNKLLTFPFANSSHQVEYINKELYIPLKVYDFDYGILNKNFSDYPTYLKISADGTYTYLNTLPKVYNNHFWGGISFKYHADFTPINRNYNESLLAFPVEPMIYKIGNGSIILKAPLKSNFISEVIPFQYNLKSFKMNLRKMMAGEKNKISDTDMKEWALTNSDYGPIIELADQGLFLRTVYIRPTKKQYHNGKSSPQYSFIIFDKDLNKLGETLLPEEYCGEWYFVNKEGLHIVNKSKAKTTFGVFKVYKK